MRRGARAAGAIVALLLFAACSSTPKTKSVVAPIVTHPSDATRGKSIVLTDADFPAGWTGTPHKQDASDRAFERRISACSGMTDSKGQTADDFGRDYGLNQAQVGSEVAFFKTAALARQDFGTVNNKRLLGCVRSALVDLLTAALTKQAPGATITKVSLGRTPVARYGDQSAALRLTVTVSVAGQRLNFYQDIVGIQKNRAEVTASFFNIGAPLPAALERSLLVKLAARLTADGGA
jgi:hypothetical protein